MASREDQEYSSQAPAPYIGNFLQQGIFPYADKFLQQQFGQMGESNSSPFTYTGDRVAGFDPREQYGMQMADQAIGSYRPYLGAQAGLLDEAAGMSRGSLRRGQEELTQGIGAGRSLTENAQPGFGRARRGMSRAEQSGYGSTQMYDPSSAQSFYNPYEDQVVQQTMKDVREGLAKGDMGMRDEAVSSGAFGGSRSRMRRDELAENTARGAAEQIGALRNQGFGQAQNQAQQAFESQQGRRAGLAGLQAGLSGQEGSLAGQEGQSRLARGQQLFGMGLQGGQGFAGMGQQTAGALGQYGGQYGGMASLLPQLQQGDIQSQMGMGGLGRGRQQSLMDLNYQNFTGQYNLPMQTLQNVGALTASLGPMAGGYGYAGGAPSYNSNYGPSGGMGGGSYGSGMPSYIPGYGGYGGSYSGAPTPAYASTPQQGGGFGDNGGTATNGMDINPPRAGQYNNSDLGGASPASQYDPSDPYYNNTGVAGGRTLPPKPQVDPASLYSDPNLGGGIGGIPPMQKRGEYPMDENTRRRLESGMDGKGTDNRKPYVDPSSLFSDPRMDVGEPVRPPPLRQVKPFNNEVKLMPGEFEGPVKEGPGFTMPAKQRPGTVQRGGQGLFNPGQQLSSAVAPPPTTTTQFQAPNSMPQRQPPRLNNGGPIAYRRRFS